jgi:peroxiredoxin
MVSLLRGGLPLWKSAFILLANSFYWGGSRKGAKRLSARHKLPFPVLVDTDRAVYRRYGLDKVLIALPRSGTFLIDKQDIVRYIHQVTNPQASVEKEELMREVEQLSKEET